MPSTQSPSTYHFEEIQRLIRNRRSIFPVDYSDATVSRETVELMLESANWAPNHGHTEPWHFVVFEKEGREAFGLAHAELYRSETPAENFQQKKYDKLKTRPTLCSYFIAICMKRGDNPKIPEIEEIEAVACAVQNMHLTATALGVAGYWTSGGMTYHPKMKELLKLREEDRCLGFFYVAKSDRQWPEGRRKSDWREKVEWRSV
ncbi:MAG: nitroreductase [Bacteroidota bacterium]